MQQAQQAQQAQQFDEPWHPEVIQLSGLKGEGLDLFWDCVTRFRTRQTASGRFAERRRRQTLAWMWERIEAGLRQRFRQHPGVREQLPRLMTQVMPLKVPLVVELGVGADWEAAH